MYFQEEERNRIVSRYAALYRQVLYGGDDGSAAAELAQLGRDYEAGLPQVPFARCPISGEVQFHSFDPFGLDGPWWNHDAPLRPLMERIPSCLAVTGAVALGGDPGNSPWLCRPGPGLPYVLPCLLALDGIFATIRQLGVGPHTAWTICYFGADTPDQAMPNAWGTGAYWDASDGSPGWSSTPDDPQERDFTLSPWIARGKLFWIAPGDDTLTLRTEVAGCPFIGLPGEQREQRIAFGRLRLDDEAPPAPARPSGTQTIGEFSLFELEDGLRDELRLPPVPVPVRTSRLGEVFPPGRPVDLDALLAEVEAFVAANPALAEGYAPLLAALGLTAGMAEAETGSHLRALACYAAGLKAAPDSVALRSHEALSLYALGRTGEAKERLEELLGAVPRGQILPLVWMLLVRLYIADGETDKARPLVEELAAFGGQDAAVAGFRAVLGGAAPAPSPPEPPAPPATPAVLPPDGPAASPARQRSLLLPILVVLALGLGGVAAWRTLGGKQDAAPAPAPVATGPSASGVVNNPAAPSDPVGDQQRRDIVGIWGPEEGGCASGFGLAFTPGGRFAMGDEYMGEEGTWQIRDGRLTQTITLAYEKQDDIGAPQATSVSRSYSYVIRQLDARRLAMDNESYAVALIRCPDGRRMFMDGERFP